MPELLMTFEGKCTKHGNFEPNLRLLQAMSNEHYKFYHGHVISENSGN